MRKACVERFYGVPWEAIQAFDLVINTAMISTELAIRWVVGAVQAMTPDPATTQLTTGSIEVDSALAHTVSEALDCATPHS